MTIQILGGVPVMISKLASEVLEEFHVERVGIRKRRRNWRVVKHYIEKPCAYMVSCIDFGFSGGEILIVHPEVLERMRGAAA